MKQNLNDIQTIIALIAREIGMSRDFSYPSGLGIKKDIKNINEQIDLIKNSLEKNENIVNSLKILISEIKKESNNNKKSIEEIQASLKDNITQKTVKSFLSVTYQVWQKMGWIIKAMGIGLFLYLSMVLKNSM